MSQKWKRSLLNIRSLRSADIATTHYLVRGYIKIKLRQQQPPRKDPLPNLNHLQYIQPEYKQELENKFNNRPANSTIDDKWNYFKTSISTTTLDLCGPLKFQKTKLVLYEKSKELIEERKKCKLKVKTRQNKSAYSKIHKETVASVHNDEEQWASNIASNIEKASTLGKQREVWQNIKLLAKKRNIR